MTIETALRLLVALARCLDLPPEVLAEMFNDEDGCQDYFNKLVAVAQEQEPVGEFA